MVCIVRLLKRRNIDMALSYLLSTILIDNQLSVILNKSQDFEQFSNYVIELGLISRKLNSFAPYFINSIDFLLDICKNLSSKEMYNKLNIQL